MDQKSKWLKFVLRSLSYVLVAVLASLVTFALWGSGSGKLQQLQSVIDQKFIGQVDWVAAEDAAAAAMVEALGDRWSYYISAKDYADFEERKDNAFVGIGITILQREDGTGFDIMEVTKDGSAWNAGIRAGDILVEAAGQSAEGMDTNTVKDLIRGKEGTKVDVAVLREGERLSFAVERQQIRTPVATGQMLQNNVGLVTIENFNANCFNESKAAVEQLLEQGAEALIFDVRNNGGGYVTEMTKLLDYLLPEGVIYRDLSYLGIEGEETSDADCLELPMSVLVNKNSFSAAEFFGAVMQEYRWATIVGEHTTGKGHYQNTIRLSDGSAVNLSTGKYFTPSGINLTEAGGIAPDVEVLVDEETFSAIYYGSLPPEEDPQIQKAVAILVDSAG
ncbi:MAG: PDZ domain-containing protein [Oscillospiraceae bacterium]|nr:PDZ domain-containing protein [Oscillospiraceae bacterium]